MPDSIQPDLDRRIDLYVRGELSPSEARELAQEALARPDLFEELNTAALAKAAIELRNSQALFEWPAIADGRAGTRARSSE
jgi:hypothetical protein